MCRMEVWGNTCTKVHTKYKSLMVCEVVDIRTYQIPDKSIPIL